MLTLDDRNEIIYLRSQGQTLEAIGQRFGVTRERIRQIIGDRIRSADIVARRRAAVHAVIVGCGYDLEEAGRKLGKGEQALMEYLTPEEVESIRRKRRWKVRNNWSASQISDDEVFAALRRAAGGKPLSAADYERRREGGLTVPRLFQRYGSWIAACEAAGIEPLGSNHGGYRSRWTDEELEEYVLTFLATDPPHPSFNAYEAWAQGNGAPSGGTIRNRLGKWADIRERLAHG